MIIAKIFIFLWCFLLINGGGFPNFRSEIEFRLLDEHKDWWQTASFYQIYPRSFKDSNGDGIGDIKGIIEMLPYLKEIGINATWISPIFKSPMIDFGYDISNFYEIDPIFGTIEDFQQLTSVAKSLDIKILLDFVPNHSSDECEWFIKSENREKGFEDFYTWHPGYNNPNDSSKRLPPNNWVSIFRNSAWTWSNKRKEFYLHQFYPKQPDLNYRNPAVVEQMKDVLRFWLSHGVDGFRVDAIPYLFEIEKDSTGTYKDEPLSKNTNDPNDYGYLEHIYTMDQNETFDMVYQWRSVLDDYKKENGGTTRILLAETYSPINVVMRYYGNKTKNGAHLPFNFLLFNLNNQSNAFDYVTNIEQWLNNMPIGRTANWVIGNHDKSRVGTRLGADRIDIMNMLVMTLPGASVTYNGEEIGMTDFEKLFLYDERDPERTPFQWNNSISAGFSTNSSTWLPVNPNYKEINLKKQLKETKSVLNIYKKLQYLRTTKTIRFGSCKVEALNINVLAIMRNYDNEKTYITVLNVGHNIENIDLTKLDKLPEELQYVAISYSSVHNIGDSVMTNNIILHPAEGAVLATKTKLSSFLGYYYYS